MAASLLVICLFLLLTYSSTSLPLCKNFRAPVIPKNPLTFCPSNGKSCCDSTKDLQLQKQFREMNISHHDCASFVKSILCATCDQFAAELFRVESEPRSIPVLCNSTDSETNFCSNVWDACQNTSIRNSPFAPSLQGSTQVPQNSSSTKLTDLWQSKTDFCNAFSENRNNNSICFNGKPISLNNNESSPPPKGLCLERISDGQYINMAPHPDGSNRAFFSSQGGTIWLAKIPDQDSGEKLGLEKEKQFLDLSDQVLQDTTFGMFGMAFHPDFANNGRFFVSYNCDKTKSESCYGRCACNTDINCDPSKMNSSGGVPPCQYHSIIAEYSTNGTATDSSMGTSAKPIEVRRIFTMGLPSSFDHGGQIVFGPKDRYLYFMMGDGAKGDPLYFSQNKKSLLGKIMRLDIDNLPSSEEIKELGLWGNYTIPSDNPYVDDVDLEPEIWALGFRNPWRCAFDSERPSYFICADIGQDKYEEVDVVTKGGNYGWSMFEGPLPFNSGENKNSHSKSDDIIFPVVGYNHSDVNSLGSAAISGGFFYRSSTDPCTYGSYLYADLYAKYIWAALETPRDSGNFTSSSIPFTCATNSPMVCSLVPELNLTAMQYVFSFGQDNKKDVFIMTSTGVYRVVRPSRCNYTCSKEIAMASNNPSPSNSRGNIKEISLFIFSLILFVNFM